MEPSVYIETTIPSFYHEERQDTEAQARRSWTRRWWDVQRVHYDLVTSAATLAELDAAPEPKRSRSLAMLAEIPVLDIIPVIDGIVSRYIENMLMPKSPVADALHLALASYYGCTYLLTWNCQNLANANKFHHMKVVNSFLGLQTPILTTPELLLGEP